MNFPLVKMMLINQFMFIANGNLGRFNFHLGTYVIFFPCLLLSKSIVMISFSITTYRTALSLKLAKLMKYRMKIYATNIMML